MIGELFNIFYKSSQGPTAFKSITISTQSPQGSIRLSRQGAQSELQKQLDQIKEDLKQSYSDTRRCQQMYANNIFDAFQKLGCNIQGTQQDKNTFLNSFNLQNQIKDFYRVLYDDCGAQIWSIAFFKDSKYYYQIQCVRTWPGYEP